MIGIMRQMRDLQRKAVRLTEYRLVQDNWTLAVQVATCAASRWHGYREPEPRRALHLQINLTYLKNVVQL